ncbi:MAG: hypothetical protein Q8P52_01515 [bacterium]|nr:hypothetical protein [bacterium]
MAYTAHIVEESLTDIHALVGLHILSHKVELTEERHNTPWIPQWTIREVEIPDEKADIVAERISLVLDEKFPWCVVFKNSTHRYVIFPRKVFSVDRFSKLQCENVEGYGQSVGVSCEDCDFPSFKKEWER